MVVANHPGGLLRAIEFGCGHDPLPDLTMPLYSLPLGLGKWSRLQQNMVGYADLADVVERGGNLERIEIRAGQAATCAYLFGKTLDPFGMEPRQQIAVAQRDRQGLGVEVQRIENRMFQ